jgi:putative endonuclease
MMNTLKHYRDVELRSNPLWQLSLKRYFVYILTNHTGTLYTGVTGNLERRIYEHKHKLIEGFTKKYNITRLVFYEECERPNVAIMREKQIKGWLRAKKIALIESLNPNWEDLSEGWFEEDRK